MKRLLLGMVAACMATSMVAQDPATYEKQVNTHWKLVDESCHYRE